MICTSMGRDDPVGFLSSHAGDLDSNPSGGLTGHTNERKRLPTVKVILHQLTGLVHNNLIKRFVLLRGSVKDFVTMADENRLSLV